MFLVGVLVAYLVFRAAFKSASARPTPLSLLLRYVFVVYACSLGAQWFAYAFDASTTLIAPPGESVMRYYFNPLSGPKTLYGAVVMLPLAIALGFAGARIGFIEATDRATPALMTILGIARVGCFLQGCCYGLRSDTFGVSFPAGSSVHGDQFLQGMVGSGDAALPVLPVQVASSLACFSLAVWSFREVTRTERFVFVRTVSAYSAFRFIIEFLRADPARNSWAALSTSQWIALAILLMATLTYGRARWSKRSPSSP